MLDALFPMVKEKKLSFARRYSAEAKDETSDEKHTGRTVMIYEAYVWDRTSLTRILADPDFAMPVKIEQDSSMKMKKLNMETEANADGLLASKRSYCSVRRETYKSDDTPMGLYHDHQALPPS